MIFFLFNYLRHGYSQDKIQMLAELIFKEDYSSKEIKKWKELFFYRFNKNQFKRTTCVPVVKVGMSLSSRGDLRLPDELD